MKKFDVRAWIAEEERKAIEAIPPDKRMWAVFGLHHHERLGPDHEIEKSCEHKLVKVFVNRGRASRFAKRNGHVVRVVEVDLNA